MYCQLGALLTQEVWQLLRVNSRTGLALFRVLEDRLDPRLHVRIVQLLLTKGVFGLLGFVLDR